MEFAEKRKSQLKAKESTDDKELKFKLLKKAEILVIVRALVRWWPQ